MDYRKNYQSWLSDPRLSEEGKRELEEIACDEKAKEYRFGGELEFGTAGMRGIIGYGMNMMNVYTVMRATKGLADFILEQGGEAAKKRRRHLLRYAEKIGGICKSGGGRFGKERHKGISF